jgi:hypothetical protein
VSWLKRVLAGQEQVPAATPPAIREIPLCGLGCTVAVLMDTGPEEQPAGFNARVGVLDGDMIVLTNTNGAATDDGAQVKLRWGIDSGERWVCATVESTSESTWTVRATGPVSHQQRRGWVRVDTAVPVRVRHRPCGHWHDGRTVNLSCGGMAAIVDVPDDAPVAGNDVDIEVALPGATVAVTGAVLQAWPDKDGHTLRVEFAEMPDVSRQKLASHVFQIQREELARRREARQ